MAAPSHNPLLFNPKQLRICRDSRFFHSCIRRISLCRRVYLQRGRSRFGPLLWEIVLDQSQHSDSPHWRVYGTYLTFIQNRPLSEGNNTYYRSILRRSMSCPSNEGTDRYGQSPPKTCATLLPRKSYSASVHARICGAKAAGAGNQGRVRSRQLEWIQLP